MCCKDKEPEEHATFFLLKVDLNAMKVILLLFYIEPHFNGKLIDDFFELKESRKISFLALLFFHFFGSDILFQ